MKFKVLQSLNTSKRFHLTQSSHNPWSTLVSNRDSQFDIYSYIDVGDGCSNDGNQMCWYFFVVNLEKRSSSLSNQLKDVNNITFTFEYSQYVNLHDAVAKISHLLQGPLAHYNSKPSLTYELRISMFCTLYEIENTLIFSICDVIALFILCLRL